MSNKNEQGGMDVKQKNVLNAPLHQHSAPSSAPKNLPSILHAGFCNPTSPIAATITNAFLDLTASNGTDLRKAGVGPGQRYCIDAASWKGLADKGKDVPRVKLESTHQGALEKVGLDVLKKWAAKADIDNKTILPEGNKGKEGKEGFVRESGKIGGKEPKA